MHRGSRFFMPLLVLLALVLPACNSVDSVPTFSPDRAKVRIAASFYPLSEFSRAVGGDHVSVINLVPAGVEPHDWEPTTRHILRLNEARLFVYNGAGFEHWTAKTLTSLNNQNLVGVETTQGFHLINLAGAEPGGNSGLGVVDPHIWLDPQGAIHQVTEIRTALVQVDPANRVAYEANASAYTAKLTALDQEFREGLSQCRTKRFFTSHAAFSYLAAQYGLEQHAIMGLSPDAEPKPQDLSRIVNEAKQWGIRYIFFETLVSDKVAKTVAGEVGAKTLVLNPLEGLTTAEIQQGQNYLSVMRTNLINLKLALECGK
jgi:zinc transport system substrate-binding protein